VPDFLRQLDGTGRSPRDIQRDALRWIDANWRHQILALQLPVGCGKSLIAESISKVTGAHVITPSNALIDQYRDTYPKKNYLKGKEHYTCHSSGMSCYDWQNVAEMKVCAGCPYIRSRDEAVAGTPTFFNPMSLYYAAQSGLWKWPSVLVVDEAHQLAGMVQLLSGSRLRHSEYAFPENANNEKVLLAWLDDQVQRLKRLARYYKADPTRLKAVLRELEHLRLTQLGFIEDAQNYVVWAERGTYRGRPDSFLCIKPILPPKKLVREILGASKLILMSGTLLSHDLRGLLADLPFAYYDAPSAIPVEHRTIRYRPASFKMNAETNPSLLAKWIIDRYEHHGRPNTIVHVSYATSERLRPLLSDRAIFNTPEDKIERIGQFRKDGGLFIAAGCAEGLDLVGDICRLNLIPGLIFPNLGDPVVLKRKGLADGKEWYALETLKTVIQQAGRSTRGPDDFSIVEVGDSNFPWLVKSVKQKLPQSFLESIQWSS
jgi:Rad3-related DNA helicase